MTLLDPSLYYYTRELPDGRGAAVQPLLFERAQIVVWSGPDDSVYDDMW